MLESVIITSHRVTYCYKVLTTEHLPYTGYEIHTTGKLDFILQVYNVNVICPHFLTVMYTIFALVVGKWN